MHTHVTSKHTDTIRNGIQTSTRTPSELSPAAPGLSIFSQGLGVLDLSEAGPVTGTGSNSMSQHRVPSPGSSEELVGKGGGSWVSQEWPRS